MVSMATKTCDILTLSVWTTMLNMVMIWLNLMKLQLELALFWNIASNVTWFYLNTPVWIIYVLICFHGGRAFVVVGGGPYHGGIMPQTCSMGNVNAMSSCRKWFHIEHTHHLYDSVSYNLNLYHKYTGGLLLKIWKVIRSQLLYDIVWKWKRERLFDDPR